LARMLCLEIPATVKDFASIPSLNISH